MPSVDNATLAITLPNSAGFHFRPFPSLPYRVSPSSPLPPAPPGPRVLLPRPPRLPPATALARLACAANPTQRAISQLRSLSPVSPRSPPSSTAPQPLAAAHLNSSISRLQPRRQPREIILVCFSVPGRRARSQARCPLRRGRSSGLPHRQLQRFETRGYGKDPLFSARSRSSPSCARHSGAHVSSPSAAAAPSAPPPATSSFCSSPSPSVPAPVALWLRLQNASIQSDPCGTGSCTSPPSLARPSCLHAAAPRASLRSRASLPARPTPLTPLLNERSMLACRPTSAAPVFLLRRLPIGHRPSWSPRKPGIQLCCSIQSASQSLPLAAFVHPALPASLPLTLLPSVLRLPPSLTARPLSWFAAFCLMACAMRSSLTSRSTASPLAACACCCLILVRLCSAAILAPTFSR